MPKNLVTMCGRHRFTDTVLRASLALLLFAAGQSQGYVEVSSPSRYEYQAVTPPPPTTVASFSRLCFSVKICDNAHVLLASQGPNCSSGEPLYEIVIGGWGDTQSVIRDECQSADPVVTVTHEADPGALSCDAFRTFYVSWGKKEEEGEGLVRVVGVEVEGGRSVAEHVLMEHHGGLSFPVHFLSVSGWDKAGLWRLDFTCQSLWQTSTASSEGMTTAPSATETSSSGAEFTSKVTVSTKQTTESTLQNTESTSQGIESTSQTTESTSQATESTSQTTEFTSQATKFTSLATVSTSLATVSTSQATESTSRATESTSRATDSTSLAKESTSQAKESTSQARESTSLATDSPLRTTEATLTTTSPQPTQSSSAYTHRATIRNSWDSSTPHPTAAPTSALLCHCANCGRKTAASDDSGEGLGQLLISPNTTSKARRRLTSAVDRRVSSTTIGITGVVCLVVPFLLLICSDVTNAVRYLGTKYRGYGL